MRFLNRHFSVKQMVKFGLLIACTIAVSRYGVAFNSSLDRYGREQGLERFTSLEGNAGIQQVAALGIPNKASMTKTRREAEQMVLEFVVKRKLRGQKGALAGEVGSVVAMYNRDNTPGYFRRRNWHWTLTRIGEYPIDVYMPPSVEVPEQRLPTVFVLGVSNCGSDTLIEYMGMHPHLVSVSPEVRYFDYDENLMRGLDWYKAQMPLTFTDQVTVDINPSYFWDHRAPRKLHKMNTGMKFVVVLRDPVQRILSLEPNAISEEDMTSSVDEIKKVISRSWAVSSGVYVKFMKQWLEYFPLSQFHILEYEDLLARPVPVMQDVEDFLKIPHKITVRNFTYNTTMNSYCAQPFHFRGTVCPRSNREKGRMDSSQEKYFYEFYSGFNNDLFNLLGRNFDWRRPSFKKINTTDRHDT